MATVRLRVRSKNGGVTNISVSGSTPLLEFAVALESSTKISALHQKFLTGHPPTSVHCYDKQAIPISSLFQTGDVVTVEDDPSHIQIISTPTPATTTPTTTTHTDTVDTTPSTTIATALPIVTVEKPYRPPPPAQKGTIQQIQEGGVIRRKIADDNSCLFNAIGYVLESGSTSKAKVLRDLVSHDVEFSPEFTEVMLGKTKAEYASWIKLPNSWGGGIEVSILSEEYKTEICTFDILTKNAYCYGEGQGYTQRVYLLYDGIHYDALVVNLLAEEGGPPELDITIFSPEDVGVKDKMSSFVEKLNKAGQYTNMAALKIVCRDCNTVLVGEKDMALHAAATGHGRFEEIKK